MAINQTPGVFFVGPQGRSVNVNASGFIEATEGGDLQVYSIGEKGRALGVDANGKMGVIVSSPMTVNDSVTSSGAVDLNSLRQFDFKLTENKIFTSFDNPDDGAKYMFVLEQDSAGSYTVTWPSNVKWRGGSAPTLSTASGSIDVVTMVYRNRDETFLADVGLDFS